MSKRKAGSDDQKDNNEMSKEAKTSKQEKLPKEIKKLKNLLIDQDFNAFESFLSTSDQREAKKLLNLS